MKRFFGVLSCVFTLNVGAVEIEQLFENDQMNVFKAVIAPHEEIGLHRDETTHLVIALKGGTITRLEANGTTTDVQFPTGSTVIREADPVNEQHRSINNSDEPVELVIIQLKNQYPGYSKGDKNSHEIAVNIKIECPPSLELNDFAISIPTPGTYSTSFEDWKSSFINNMNQLIRLVESEKVYNSFWSARTDVPPKESSKEMK